MSRCHRLVPKRARDLRPRERVAIDAWVWAHPMAWAGWPTRHCLPGERDALRDRILRLMRHRSFPVHEDVSDGLYWGRIVEAVDEAVYRARCEQRSQYAKRAERAL